MNWEALRIKNVYTGVLIFTEIKLETTDFQSYNTDKQTLTKSENWVEAIRQGHLGPLPAYKTSNIITYAIPAVECIVVALCELLVQNFLDTFSRLPNSQQNQESKQEVLKFMRVILTGFLRTQRLITIIVFG